jgi:hypothetical protein
MAAWLYPISARAGRFFELKNGQMWPVNIDTYRLLIEKRRLAEDDAWYIKMNLRKVHKGDDVYVYTGDQDLGIIGYAKVKDLQQDNEGWFLDLRFDLKKCQLLLRDLPIRAPLVRRWVAPRAAVVSLKHVEMKLKKLLPWKSGYAKPRVSAALQNLGGGSGFGDPAKNRKVEEAAVRKVTSDFRKLGWEVVSVEEERKGFDLLCVKGEQTRKVEVKGVSGSKPSFILTAGEFRVAADENFRLHVVLNALSKAPVVKKWSGKQMKRDFDFNPIQYFAALKS